ncbi:MAG: hypothetical protein U0270_30005 [Labilithrix sp.]
MKHTRLVLAASLTLALVAACSETETPPQTDAAITSRPSNARCVAPAEGAPALLSQLGCFETNDPHVMAKGVVEYEPAAALWSDGAGKPRYFAIPDGTSIHVEPDGHFTFPNGTVLFKSFILDGRLVETRVFFRYASGTWGGYSYEWNDAQTDATLLEGSKQKTVGTTTWSFPARRDCFRCHNANAAFTIGPELAQLNGPIGTRPENQLETLSAAGYLDAPLPPVTSLQRLPRYDDPAASLEDRARSYLHGNCAHCHRPGGPGYGTAYFRFSTPFAAMGICNAESHTGPNAVLFAPGSSATSVISQRMHALDYKRMPALGTAIVDPIGTDLVDRWINATTACPPPP